MTEHEIASGDGARIVCTCGVAFTAATAWAALMAASRHAAAAADL